MSLAALYLDPDQVESEESVSLISELRDLGLFPEIIAFTGSGMEFSTLVTPLSFFHGTGEIEWFIAQLKILPTIRECLT